MSTTATLDREQLGQAARMRADGATWKAIGALFNYSEKAVKGAMDRAIVREQLGDECPAVRTAIPADWYGAMAAHIQGECPACNATPADDDPDAAVIAGRILSGETTFLDEVGAILNGQPVTERPADGCTVIAAPHYAETVAQLVNDPHIIDMAHGLMATPMEDIVNPSGSPRHEFMMGALAEYNKRTGEGGGIPTHIGGPADAVLQVLAGLREQLQANADAVAEALAPALDDEAGDTYTPDELREMSKPQPAPKPAKAKPAKRTAKAAEAAAGTSAASYPADDITRAAEAVIDAIEGGARLSGKTSADAGTVNARTAAYMSKIGPFKVVDLDGARRLVRA
jgi:hypothetical protein